MTTLIIQSEKKTKINTNSYDRFSLNQKHQNTFAKLCKYTYAKYDLN